MGGGYFDRLMRDFGVVADRAFRQFAEFTMGYFGENPHESFHFAVREIFESFFVFFRLPGNTFIQFAGGNPFFTALAEDRLDVLFIIFVIL